MRELLRRRVPQTALGFFIAGWGLVQFVQFLEQRYTLSPYWVEVVALGWLLLLPSVLLIAWAHGAPGTQAWSRRQGAFVSTNVVLTVAVLILGFSGRDLGATTTTVTVEDEEGRTVERQVARESFRHEILLSFPLLDGLPEDERWRSTGFAYLLENDLFQNPFLEVRSPWTQQAAAERAGVDDVRSAPAFVVRDLARKLSAEFYLLASIGREEEEYVLRMQLMRTEEGIEQTSASFRGEDLFSLVDGVSVWLREEMGLPRADGDLFPDRPVAEIVSDQPEILRPMAEGFEALVFENEPRRALEAARRAVEIDATSASAHMIAHAASLQLSDLAIAREAVDQAMKYAYRLSERQQFVVRASYYFVRNDIEKGMAVLAMWRKLMPGDTMALRMLAVNQTVLGEKDEAIATYGALLEVVPDDVAVLEQRAELLVDRGRVEEALAHLRRLADLQPTAPAPRLGLARALRDQGELGAARAAVEQAQLLDPTDVDALLLLADLLQRGGANEEAASTYEAALATATGDHARKAVLDATLDFERRRGRLLRALDLLADWEEVAARVSAPTSFAMQKAQLLEILAELGRAEEARAHLATLGSDLGEPVGRFLILGEVLIALEEEDAALARVAVDALSRTVREFRIEVLRPRVMTLEARVLALEGEHETALARCDSARILDASYRPPLVVRARSELALGDAEGALATLERYLEADPFHPWANLEAARTLERLARPGRAREHLQRALAVWEQADPAFDDARLARELMESVDSGP